MHTDGALLYHFQLGIPKELKIRFGMLDLVYSMHAQNAARDDRYGRIELPLQLDTDTAKIIEVEADLYGNVSKVLYRVHHDKLNDIVLAVVPDTKVVKTVWLNAKKDLHKTLDRSKYTQPRRK